MSMLVPIKSKSNRTLLAASIQLLALFTLSVFISACASNPSDDQSTQGKRHKAAEFNTSLGLEYMTRGQYEVALGKLKKAIKADPGYAQAHTVIAVLYERIGEMELAGKHYHKAYQAAPSKGDVNNNYGVYLCQTGEGNQATEHFLKALDDPFYSSPSVALTNAGSCALGKGELTEANNYLRRALKIEPEFPDALLTMARLNFEQQNYLTSRAFIQRYEAVASHGPESLLLAYRVETASDDDKRANKYKRSLETDFPKSDQTAEVRRISGT